MSAKRSRSSFLPALVFLILLLFNRDYAKGQNGADLEQQLRKTEAALAKIDNYTAIFHRTERVKGKLLPEQTTFLKFKRPFKVYMRWISPDKGQESLYVQGANNNKVRAHGTGLTGLITANLDPTGGLAMEDTRHPITEAGLDNLMRTITDNVEKGRRAGELTSTNHGGQTVYGRKAAEFEGILPKDPAKGYYCYRCVVDVDVETQMPIKTQIFAANSASI